jgi:hypothetical protein
MIRLLRNLSLVLALTAAAHAEVLTYSVQVNTSSLSGDSGYLDLQFNPGLSPSDPATVTLSGFTGNGTLVPGAALGGNTGDVTGTLPGTVTIGNAGAYNDYNEGYTFGSFFDLLVTLNLPTVSGTAASGSSFALGLYQSDDATQYLTAAPSLVEIDLSANGAPTVTSNSPDAQVTTATATPEPGSWLLVASGISAPWLWRRRWTAAGQSR